MINETDVSLAKASDAIIIGFNIKPNREARNSAEKQKVRIEFFNIIYKAIEFIEKSLSGLLEPEKKENIEGVAEILKIFKLSKSGKVAGSKVTEGEIKNNSKASFLIRFSLAAGQLALTRKVLLDQGERVNQRVGLPTRHHRRPKCQKKERRILYSIFRLRL